MTKEILDSPQKVLIVEDNPSTMELMNKYFAKALKRGDLNCETIEAQDGEDAIQMVNMAQPDLIMFDIKIPKKCRFEVLNYLRNERAKEDPYCFFVFISASDDEKKRAYETGADGFVRKTEINYFVLTLQIKSWLRLVLLEREQSVYY